MLNELNEQLTNKSHWAIWIQVHIVTFGLETVVSGPERLLQNGLSPSGMGKPHTTVGQASGSVPAEAVLSTAAVPLNLIDNDMVSSVVPRTTLDRVNSALQAESGN
ncbi:hypothetical protein N7449_001046 [Penicillium cf. viridicatum]|uniref:Uncharacterized protein n=1 Tax=Penicillium cf. viridicatum TaxID=2972119 RepID=A0A9W9N645_9EURO|nr:hypothetical protein N7449_001046 [Penicillium cf. viridicatum]